jgi:tRNA pseudouridine55 synthase
MDAILVVNKDKDWSSRDVVNKLNHIFNERKIGHAGTLDPLATGVLVICTGRYTKFVSKLISDEKEYIATMHLGIKTDTLDITGNVIQKEIVNIPLTRLESVLNSFKCSYEQTVPIYSAVQIDGKRLYDYARKGIEIETPKRIVTIYDIELIKYENQDVVFKVVVSKGTYIRSLIDDIAKKLGTIATMTDLKRTREGIFSIDDAYSIKDISDGKYNLVDPENIFKYPSILTNDQTRLGLINGNLIKMNVKDGCYFIKDSDKIIAIYEFVDGNGRQTMKL